jgi:hypothetical protein
MQHYRLPDGQQTTDSSKYLNEWNELKEAIERVLDVHVYAYDPDISVRDHFSIRSAELPLWLAKRIAALSA